MPVIEDVIEFPSVEWFDFLCDHSREEPEIYEALGFANFRLAVEITRDSGKPRQFGIFFDGYDVISYGELADGSTFDPEAVVTGSIETWREMANNILANGVADSSHTLNALSIADTPLRVFSSDPLGKDKFFRYAETIQTLFDATSRQREGTVVA